MKIALAAAVAMLVLPLATPASAGECRRPAVETLVTADDPQAGGPFLLVGPVQADVQWLAVQWEGPPSGKVVALDCAGHVLAIRPLGHVESLTPGPMVAGAPTVEVRYQPASGPNGRWINVELMQVRDGDVSTLWWFEATILVAVPGYPAKAQVYDWRYVDPGPSIHISGTETVGEILDMRTGAARGTVRKLPDERWCFQPQDAVFLPCRYP